MKRLLEIAKRVQALAQNGLFYTESDFDRERYEELQELSVEVMSLLTDQPIEKLELHLENPFGYATPKVDVRGVVFRDDKLLMVQEQEDNLWSIPGGWADIGFSPNEIAVKEVFEEAGLVVEAKKLIGIVDKKFYTHPSSPFYVYKIFIHCEYLSGELKPNHETMGLGFFDKKEIPPLSPGRIAPEYIERIFDFYSNPAQQAWVD